MKNFIQANAVGLMALIISLGTLIFSIISHNGNKKRTEKVAEKTLNKEFFEKIYFKYIIDKLPQALDNIEAKSDNAKDECDVMQKLVLEVLNKSRFYKYFDKTFYEKIKNIIIDLDEQLVVASKVKNRDVFRDKKAKIVEKTEQLYEELRVQYSKIK